MAIDGLSMEGFRGGGVKSIHGVGEMEGGQHLHRKDQQKKGWEGGSQSGLSDAGSGQRG